MNQTQRWKIASTMLRLARNNTDKVSWVNFRRKRTIARTSALRLSRAGGRPLSFGHQKASNPRKHKEVQEHLEPDKVLVL
jgi:hypothetical protein